MGTHDDAVKQATDSLEEARQKCEAVVAGFSDIVSTLVTDWAKSMVERAVVNKPDSTAALKQGRLTEMKARYGVILQSIPSQAVAELSRDEVWPHRQTISEDDMGDTMFAYSLKQRNKEQLDNAIRELMSDVGSLLIEYGFATASDRSEWQGRQGGKPRYSYAIPDSPQLKKARVEYDVTLEEWVSASRRLRDAKQAKASAEAKMLWDEA